MICATAFSLVWSLTAFPRPGSSPVEPLGGPSPSSIDTADRTALDRAVPSDVGLYFHARMPIDSTGESVSALAEVRRALSTAGFMAPFARYLDEVVLAKERRALDPELEYWRQFLEERAWWRLFESEFFLVGRLEFKLPEEGIYRRAWMMGFRVAPRERELFLSMFRELFEAFAAVVPGSELDEGRRDGSRVTCLYNLLPPSREICTAAHGGVVLVSTSRSLLRQSLQLLSGETTEVSFRLRRASELERVKGDAPSSGPLSWLSAQSDFFRAHVAFPKDDVKDERSVAGFELMVKPRALFADLLLDDPLLSDWKSLNVAGDFRGTGLRCFFDTDLQAGQEELERVLYRALVEPIEEPRLAPVLYREVGVLLPRESEELEPPEVTVLMRELARWLKNGFGVLDPGGRRVTSETVTGPGGGKRLRGEATFPLVVRESARKG